MAVSHPVIFVMTSSTSFAPRACITSTAQRLVCSPEWTLIVQF
jgi:hypothetical protein